MASVSDQLKARRGTAAKPTAAAAKTAAKPAAKPAAKAAAKPAAKPEVEAEQVESEETKPTTRGRKVERTPAEQEAYDQMKEERKQAAFAKLKELGAEKRAERAKALETNLKEARKAIKKGAIKYSTRASYYGVKCKVESIEEVRGRILVTVTCMTTKKGAELQPDAYYTRRFSPSFLQDEPPTEEYVPRRGGAVRTKKKSKKQQRAEAKLAEAGAEAEAEVDDSDLELEEEAEAETEVDLETDEDDEEEVETEDVVDEVEDEEEDGEDEDSWG